MIARKNRRPKKRKNVANLDNKNPLQKFIEYIQQFEWKHRNIIYLFVSVIIGVIIIRTPEFYSFIEGTGNFGYIGAFISGMLFTYTLTTVPATAALFVLGKSLKTPFIIALIGASGSVISDYLIFRFVREKLLDELKTTEKEIFGKNFKLHLDPNGLAVKAIPILAGLIIASPLPDEIGVALFSASKIHIKKFIQYSFLLNLIGIFIIASIGTAIV